MVLASWPRPLRNLVFSILGISWTSKFLGELRTRHASKYDVLTAIFKRNRFDVRVTGEDKIPDSGGCVFATNHPHGFFDGLGALWLGSRNNHDCRAIGRHFISVFEPIQDFFLFIKIDTERRSEQGAQVTEQSAAFVESGGRLAITAAGRLGYSKPIWKPARDLPWKTGTVRIATKANAPIVLVYSDMRHSIIRQAAQRVHPVVRALVQVWSFRFKRSQKLHLHVLDVVQPTDLPPGTVQEQTAWLQTRFNELSAAYQQ